MKTQLIEYNTANAAAKITYTGGGLAALGGLTANEIAAYGGLFLAFIGVLVQIIFSIKRNNREKAAHQREEKLHQIAVEKAQLELTALKQKT